MVFQSDGWEMVMLRVGSVVVIQFVGMVTWVCSWGMVGMMMGVSWRVWKMASMVVLSSWLSGW